MEYIKDDSLNILSPYPNNAKGKTGPSSEEQFGKSESKLRVDQEVDLGLTQKHILWWRVRGSDQPWLSPSGSFGPFPPAVSCLKRLWWSYIGETFAKSVGKAYFKFGV